MGLKDYLAVLVRRWRVILLITLLGAVAGVAIGFVKPPTYTAEAQLFVSASNTGGNPTQVYQGGNFYQQRAKSYADLATSPRVTGPVLRRTGVPLATDELADEISTDAPVDTVLVNLKVDDSSPHRSALLTNAVAAQLGKLIQDIETPPGVRKSPVKATVVRQAQPPNTADEPRLPLIVVLGVLVGLVLGIGAALLWESMDTTVKSGESLERAASLPVLTTVGRDPDSKRQPIIRDDAGGGRLEAFRQLRTNLQYADVDHRPRAVVVTSATPGEGKTSVAGNLAVTMARQGRRVCLVDGDLRQPSVAEYLGVVGEVGLTTVLIGKVGIGQALQPAPNGLAVITSGETPPNPSELLSSERMGRVLDELVTHYDMVLIDAPPVLPVTDAVVLARLADAAIMVVRSGKTTRSQLTEAVTALGNVGVRVLGGVLNMAPGKSRSAYSYGYHHHTAAGVPPEHPGWFPPPPSGGPQHTPEAVNDVRAAPSEPGPNGARAWRGASRTDRLLNPVERP
jgi:capsular exopolysaccharide synthesis family protein